MKPHIRKSFTLRQITSGGRTLGFPIKNYDTLAGAKSGLRMLKRDLLRKRIPWGSRAKCFDGLDMSDRRTIAKQLGITKHTHITEVAS